MSEFHDLKPGFCLLVCGTIKGLKEQTVYYKHYCYVHCFSLWITVLVHGGYGASLVAQTVKCLPAMGGPGFDSWVGKIPWRRKWQSTPALLPGKSHRQRSLIGYSPWGHKELDTTERLHYGGYVSMCVYTCVCLFDSLIWSTQYTREMRRNIFTLNWVVGDGQGGLACYSSWGHKELDTTERLNSNLKELA